MSEEQNCDNNVKNENYFAIENDCLKYLKSNLINRQHFIDKLLSVCEPADLIHLNRRVDEYKRDFVSLLPIEVVERILYFLDWKTILNCCQVNKVWNETISKSFNKLWYNLILEHIPLNKTEYAKNTQSLYEPDSSLINYKKIFVDLANKTRLLESGKLFTSWQIGPVEINAIVSYKNIIATGILTFYNFI
jgi:hypothetical protein